MSTNPPDPALTSPPAPPRRTTRANPPPVTTTTPTTAAQAIATTVVTQAAIVQTVPATVPAQSTVVPTVMIPAVNPAVPNVTVPAGIPAVTPIMGGVSDSTPWTGGQPNSVWSALEIPTRSNSSPNQLRPSHVPSAQKGYNFRRTGFVTKFSKSGDLAKFTVKVFDHFVDVGMDSISYLADPHDPTNMLSVVTDHPRFTFDAAKVSGASQVLSYDKFDLENDTAAKILPPRLTQRRSSHADQAENEKDRLFCRYVDVFYQHCSFCVHRAVRIDQTKIESTIGYKLRRAGH